LNSYNNAVVEREALRVEQLATNAGLSVDTIRYYQKLGVLHAPERKGRVAVYDDSHIQRLSEIRRLSEEGFSLTQIQQLSANNQHRLLDALIGDGQSALNIDELVEESGVSPDIVHLAIDAGLLRPSLPGAQTYSPDALAMLRAGAALLDSGVPLDDLISLALRHAEHVESVANEAVELFSRHLPAGSAAAQVELVRQLVPMVTELVAQHFRQALVDQAATQFAGINPDESRS
jgi:DNA-binding transcriptional MerR regulator